MIDYDQFVEIVQNALDDSHPAAALETRVLDLSSRGETKKNIYNLLLQYHLAESERKQYRELEKALGEHPVELIMDRLSGWCSEEAKLLPKESVE